MRKLNRHLLQTRLEQTIGDDIAGGMVGGVAVMVLQQGEVAHESYFSSENLGISVTEDTQFRMASMTKPITGAAILILLDRGLVTLTDPVSKYIPGFASMKLGKEENGKIGILKESSVEITILHLLTHSSGLGSGPIGNLYSAKRPGTSIRNLKEAVDYYETVLLDFEPGTAQAYSGVFAFDVLARIVEVVTGMTYEVFLRKELFEPLGMVNTTFAPNADQWDRMIPMHTYDNGCGKVVNFPANSIFEGFPTTYTAGGAGLTSTLADYIRFAQMLLNKGGFEGKQILRPETVALMATPQLPESIMPGNEIWGLSVRVITKPEYEYLPVGTFGWSGAYGTHFWVDPENEIVAVYLKNSRYDGGSGAHTGLMFERDVHLSLE